MNNTKRASLSLLRLAIGFLFLYCLATLPPEHGWVREHIIYILVFATLATHAAGRYIGADKYVEQLDFVKRYPKLKLLLG